MLTLCDQLLAWYCHLSVCLWSLWCCALWHLGPYRCWKLYHHFPTRKLPIYFFQTLAVGCTIYLQKTVNFSAQQKADRIQLSLQQLSFLSDVVFVGKSVVNRDWQFWDFCTFWYFLISCSTDIYTICSVKQEKFLDFGPDAVKESGGSWVLWHNHWLPLCCWLCLLHAALD